MVISIMLHKQTSKEDLCYDKSYILFSANDIQPKMCIFTVCHELYIFKYRKETHLNVTVV